VIEISQHFNLAFYFSGCILQGKVTSDFIHVNSFALLSIEGSNKTVTKLTTDIANTTYSAMKSAK